VLFFVPLIEVLLYPCLQLCGVVREVALGIEAGSLELPYIRLVGKGGGGGEGATNALHHRFKLRVQASHDGGDGIGSDRRHVSPC
jgi:hypothetical protein